MGYVQNLLGTIFLCPTSIQTVVQTYGAKPRAPKRWGPLAATARWGELDRRPAAYTTDAFAAPFTFSSTAVRRASCPGQAVRHPRVKINSLLRLILIYFLDDPIHVGNDTTIRGVFIIPFFLSKHCFGALHFTKYACFCFFPLCDTNARHVVGVFCAREHHPPEASNR